MKAYYNRALSKERIGDLQGSIADYTKVIDLNPKYYQAYLQRGDIRYDLEINALLAKITKNLFRLEIQKPQIG